MLRRDTRFIQGVFSRIPTTYEVINHVLTLGLDSVWRRRAAKIAAMANGGRWIDVCTGTGEMAVQLVRLAPEGTTVYALDFACAMLAEAKKKPEAGDIAFVASDARALPFGDESFDLITISFATRNINPNRDALVETFAEFHRVLKRGGRFVNLETSRPAWPLLGRCFELYVKLVVESIGSRISGCRSAYAYLSSSMRGFYSADELADIMRQAGFGEVTFRRYMLGATAVHHGVRP